MRYEDFALAFRTDGEDVVVELVHGGNGRARERFVEPRQDGGEPEIEPGGAGDGTSAASHAARDVAPPSPAPPQRDRDAKLYRALFTGTIRERWRESLAAVLARPDARGLRLRLIFDLEDDRVHRLSRLFWERMWDPERAIHMGLDTDAPLVRDVAIDTLRRTWDPVVPSRVVAVAPAPAGLPRLELAEELATLRSVLDSAGIALHVVIPPTLEATRDAVLDGPCHGLHFLGHGHWNDELRQGVLVFEDAARAAHEVAGEIFAEHLARVRQLGFVVLNCCHSADHGRALGDDAYTGVATALLRGGVGNVIAMRSAIRDPAALVFARRLYERLRRRDPLDAAVAEGRMSVHARFPELDDWAKPILFLRSETGEVFAPPGVVAATSPPASRTAAGAAPLLGTREDRVAVGIAVFRHPTQGVGSVVHDPSRILWLDDRFTGSRSRELAPDESWEGTIFPAVREHLTRALGWGSSFLLACDAQLGIAYAAGHVWYRRVSPDVALRQRTNLGVAEWRPVPGAVSPEPLWLESVEETPHGEGNEVAIAVSLTREVGENVRAYFEQARPPVRELRHFRMAPAPSVNGIRDADHACHLAQALARRLEALREDGVTGPFHLFLSGPWSFAFYLGQESVYGLGRLTVYEFFLEEPEKGKGRYVPGITLPVG